MKNFEFYNPTRYVFGHDQIKQLSKLIPKNEKILILYGGGSIFKNGIHQQVVRALEGYEIGEYGGIEANPHYETLMKAVEKIREHNYTYLLAVGGGSVIDGVKFISGAVHFDGDPIDILKKRILIKDKAMPFGTVLTLPATASEMNSGAVITIKATQEKLTTGGEKLFPQFSIVDPSVILSLPKRQLENGVIDAFFHVLEQYLTYPQGAILQDKFSESIIATLVEVGPKVIDNPSDETSAHNFIWSCTMALNGLIQKGVETDWSTHFIGHELTALYDIDHARTLAIVGPHLYDVVFEHKKAKLAQLGHAVFGINITTNEEETARLTIQNIREFLQKMGMPLQLSDCNIQANADLAKIIVKRFDERGWKAIGEKQIITLEGVQSIIEKCL